MAVVEVAAVALNVMIYVVSRRFEQARQER
jgi:hypothetical protein